MSIRKRQHGAAPQINDMEKRAAVTRTVGGGVATVTATRQQQDPAVQTIYIQQITVGAGGAPASGAINIPSISNAGVPVVTVTSVPVVTRSSVQSVNTASTQVVSVGPAAAQSTVYAQSAGFNGVGGNANPESYMGGSSGLSGGAIAGIVIGAIAGAALLLGLILFALARRRENERRAVASDMMASSGHADPYASSVLTRELPGSFVRFDNYSEVGSMAGLGSGAAMGAGGAAAASGANSRRRPMSGYESEGGYGTGTNAYDDVSAEEDDYAPRRDNY